MAKIPEVALGSTQATIPVVGFGTAVYPLVASQTMKDSILEAIRLGYRHFDSAALYDSEQPLGEVVAEALRTELIKSRSELFITSKLWSSDAHHDRVLPALHKTLQNLGIEYLDLYLLHYPVSLEPGAYDFPFDKKRLVPMDFKAVWEAMEECQKLGLTRFIGVSNFSIQKLEKLLATANIPPAVNQVEMSPLWQQKNLREFCERKGIHITAYSPLGAKGTPWGTNGVMECEVLKQIAEAKGKTLAQVCLRWVYEQGVSVLVKSFNKERMQVNLDIFDWTLSPEDSHMISQIKQHKGHPGFQLVSEEGPFKSVEELWDMEIDDHVV